MPNPTGPPQTQTSFLLLFHSIVHIYIYIYIFDEPYYSTHYTINTINILVHILLQKKKKKFQYILLVIQYSFQIFLASTPTSTTHMFQIPVMLIQLQCFLYTSLHSHNIVINHHVPLMWCLFYIKVLKPGPFIEPLKEEVQGF